MLKKVLRYISIFILSLMGLLIVASTLVWINREKILLHFTKEAQKLLTTDVHVKAMDVSLLEHFPNITIDIDEVFIKEAIEGSSDTLLYAKRLELSFSLKDIFNKKYEVKSIHLRQAKAKLYWDNKGNNNFTIYKTDTSDLDTSNSSFNFALNEIYLEETDLSIIHLKAKNNHRVFIHELTSGLSWKENILDLDLDGEVDVQQIGLDKDVYFKNKALELHSSLIYKLDKESIAIESAQIGVENAEFNIHGGANMKNQNYVDLSLSASKSEIQTILSILPNRIYKLVKNYKSKGEVYFKGTIKGAITDRLSPQIDISFGFENATFYHPESNQEITNAFLEGSYSNGAKQNLSTSSFELKDFKANLSGQAISGNFLYKNFNDPYIEFFINGSFDAQKLFGFIPEAGVHPTTGKLSVNLFFSGMQKHLRTQDGAQHLNTSGQLFISDFDFTIDHNNLNFTDFNGSFLFDKNDLIINGFQGNIGQSDFDLSGFFHNVISYLLLEEQTLGIAAEFYSDYLNLDELLSQKTESKVTSSPTKTDFHIPANLALQFNCAIDSVKFQNLTGKDIGKNLKGSIDLQYQSILFQDIHFSTAGGNIHLNTGFLEAKDDKDMRFRTEGSLEKIDVERMLLVLDNFHQEFLTNQNLQGELSGVFEVEFDLSHGLDVRMPTIDSKLGLVVDNGKLLRFEPMMELGLFLKKKKFNRYLKSDRFSEISFSQLKETINIKDEKIEIPFMEIKSSVTDMTISGTHSFDADFDYKISFPLINYGRRERLKERGVNRNKKSNEIEVHLNIVGNAEDFEVDFLGKETTKSVLNVTQDQFVADEKPVEVGIDTTQELSEEEEELFEGFFD